MVLSPFVTAFVLWPLPPHLEWTAWVSWVIFIILAICDIFSKVLDLDY